MNIHECMKCRFYLTHFDDVIICVRNDDAADLPELMVTVNRLSDPREKCLLFSLNDSVPD